MLHYHSIVGKMNNRMTGDGKLSRKVLAVVLAVISVTVWAADNSIFIDQAGDNAQVIMTQDGVGNRIQGLPGIGTGSTTPAKIYGDGNIVTVNQIGSGNILGLEIATTTGNGSPSVSYTQQGNNALASIKSMNPGSTNDSPTITVNQSGDGSLLNIDQSGNQLSAIVTTAGGNNNSVSVLQRGTGASAVVNMTGGGGNTATIDQQDGAHVANVLVLGATNTIGITQSGSGGTNGHSAGVDLIGSGNTISVNQSGNTVDNIAGLKSVGSGNAITINQHN